MRSEHLQQKEKARKEAEERQQFRKEYSKSSGIKQPAPQKHSKNTFELTNKKNRAIAFFQCLFLGLFGAHRFNVGKVKTAILYFLTIGLFGIGWFVDIILILTGNFKDKNGIEV